MSSCASVGQGISCCGVLGTEGVSGVGGGKLLQCVSGTLENSNQSTTSTSFVMMLCDCLANTIMEKKKFTKENFFLYHKGGNLGASLRLAKDIMVSGRKMPIISSKKKFSEL